MVDPLLVSERANAPDPMKFSSPNMSKCSGDHKTGIPFAKITDAILARKICVTMCSSPSPATKYTERNKNLESLPPGSSTNDFSESNSDNKLSSKQPLKIYNTFHWRRTEPLWMIHYVHWPEPSLSTTTRKEKEKANGKTWHFNPLNGIW